MDAIEVSGLTRIYPGGITAVDGITFTVGTGEIFGLLGPNGAGKSTTILMLTTLVRPSAGSARVMGYDVVSEQSSVRKSLGYVSQDLAVDDDLTGWENLQFQAWLYGLSQQESARRISEVLQTVGLADRANDPVANYSGGMRKRLDIAAGLIHRPQVLFLDEPTLGLDIHTRREIWSYINRLRLDAGMTILLTTHYMDEADRLCDRVAIIDQGTIRAIDAPGRLKMGLGGDIITLCLSGSDNEIDLAASSLRSLPGVTSLVRHGDQHRLVVEDGEATLPNVFRALQPTGASVLRVSVHRPTLDDVYLAFTGRELRNESSSREDGIRQRMVMRRVRGR